MTDRHLMPGIIADNWGQLNAKFGGDDTTYKCSCTDANILVNYFRNFI